MTSGWQPGKPLSTPSERHALVPSVLQEAQVTLQNLQARLAHAELAHSEALAAERASRERAEKALQEAVAARDASERQLRTTGVQNSIEPGRKRGRPKKIVSATAPTDKAPARKARGPQPVKWWLPSYRAK